MWVILLTLSERIFKFASMSIMLAPIHLFALLLLHHCSRQTPSKVASAPTELSRATRVCSSAAPAAQSLHGVALLRLLALTHDEQNKSHHHYATGSVPVYALPPTLQPEK